MLNKAIEIATKAHEGQVDKAGQPYISHPLRVMAMGATEDEKIVGVLHDVVEDSDWTFERLAAEGFSSEVIDALRCVTKLSESEPYDKFIQRVKTNPLAVKVKINDLTDNMDIRRLAYISEKDVKRLRKYLKAYKQLLGEPAYSVEACRIDYPNAYMPWTQEDDDKLEELFCEGKTTKELSDIFQRKQGAIHSRVKKLELEEKYK
ncbi:HD domain-containing protein [Parabacteroides chinchillae]